MKTYRHLSLSVVMGLAITPVAHPGVGARRVQAFNYSVALQGGRNEISGTIFGESNRPVADIYVELLDDFGSNIAHSKTTSSGRFNFSRLLNGNYRVKVLPFGTDYQEQTQEVTLAAISVVAGGGSDRQNLDIYLKLKERPRSPFAAGPGVVFVQDIPPAASKLYTQGIAYLSEKKEKEGFESLKQALEIFPNYYLALDRLGAEYAMKGQANRAYWEAGLVLLTKAVEVNPRGFSSVFGLGWIQYQLGLNERAVETLTRATTIYGKGADAYLWLGKALKRASNLGQAETAFKRANELTNGKVADIHWELAALYNDQKRYNEAADELELFLKSDKTGADKEKIRELIKQLREKQTGTGPPESSKLQQKNLPSRSKF